jgi:hypothetical protein
MLSNENGGEDCDSKYVYWYMVYLYLIAIYVYSMYLMRYGRTDIEYDVLVNPDRIPEFSKKYIHLLLLERYLTNIKAMFDVYSGAELSKAVAETAKAAKAAKAASKAVDAVDATEATTDSLMPSSLSDFSAIIPNDITALASNPLAQAQALANPTNLLQGLSDPTALLQGKAQAFGNPFAQAQALANPAALAKGFGNPLSRKIL